MSNYQLAQINVAQLLEPMDSPLLADFVADIDRINTIAENSDGFVWRLKDSCNSENPFNDSMMIVNISVWENVESLKNFTFRSEHIEVYIKRAKWFSRMKEAHLAMWWVARGQYPTAAEAAERLAHLRQMGDTLTAFSFKKVFEKPN